MTQQYDVFMFHLPQVSGDGKSILGPSSQTKRFDQLESAFAFAQEHCQAFNRITIHVASSDAPTLVGRFVDGAKLLPDGAPKSADDSATSADPGQRAV